MECYWDHGLFVYVERDASGNEVKYNGNKHQSAMLKFSAQMYDLKRAEEKEVNQLYSKYKALRDEYTQLNFRYQALRSEYKAVTRAERAAIEEKYSQLREAIQKPDKRDFPMSDEDYNVTCLPDNMDSRQLRPW